MKTIIAVIGALALLVPSIVAGQADSRFVGIWKGEETYVMPGQAPIKKSASVSIGYGGTVLNFQGGLLQSAAIDVTPVWGNNTLKFKVNQKTLLGSSFRTHGELVLSADGSTLTETGFASLPGKPHSIECNISGRFRRAGKNPYGGY